MSIGYGGFCPCSIRFDSIRQSALTQCQKKHFAAIVGHHVPQVNKKIQLLVEERQKRLRFFSGREKKVKQ